MEIAGYILLVVVLLIVLYVVLPALFGSPWWPAPKKDVIGLLVEADLKEDEILYDLGCGDGRVLITASRMFGVRCVGVEIDPIKVFIAKAFVRLAGLSDKIKIIRSSVFKVSIKEADVVFLYLSHQLIDKLTPKFLEELKPEARIISYGFLVKGLTLYKTDKRKRGFVYKMSIGRNVNRFL